MALKFLRSCGVATVALVFLSLTLLLAGCGRGIVADTSSAQQTPGSSTTTPGGGDTTPTTPTISVSPASATLTSSGTQQFTASVTNESSTAVSWIVDGVAGGNSTTGSITANGLYTAPNASGTHTVSAASAADPQLTASATVTVTSPTPPPPTVSGVYTYKYDNGRTGLNANETKLTLAAVNDGANFGKLGTWTLDGSIYTQPLYVPGVSIGSGTYNVLYVCTENDSCLCAQRRCAGKGAVEAQLPDSDGEHRTWFYQWAHLDRRQCRDHGHAGHRSGHELDVCGGADDGRWQPGAAPACHRHHDRGRYIVLDCDQSGGNGNRDGQRRRRPCAVRHRDAEPASGTSAQQWHRLCDLRLLQRQRPLPWLDDGIRRNHTGIYRRLSRHPERRRRRLLDGGRGSGWR